jgi:hypothetical protein
MTKIRPNLEYAAAAWSTGLTRHLKDLIESVQKRALRIVYGEKSYTINLANSGLETLEARRDTICRDLFKQIQAPGHPLHSLLPPKKQVHRTLRNQRLYNVPLIRTERCKKSYIYYCISNF